MKTTGLVLGKFAPLHKGHQSRIDRASKETDKVVVLIYDCPETIDIPLSIRAGWIRQLYPQAEVIEGRNGPTVAGRKKWIMRIQEQYAIKMVKQPITHFYSSEWYGKHMSRALGAKNVLVDRDRKIVPVSGTKIRKNPLKYKQYVEPLVYRDLIKKIVFFGAESTGKTTIARETSKIFKTQWMPEYGREFWNKYQKNGKLTLFQLYKLAKGHLAKEDELLEQANKYLFVDTNAITTEMFSRFYHNQVHPKLIELAKEAEKRYDLNFVCDIDIPYEDDGARSGEEQRIKFQQQIINDLQKRGIKYTLLSGSLEKRMKKIKQVLGARTL